MIFSDNIAKILSDDNNYNLYNRSQVVSLLLEGINKKLSVRYNVIIFLLVNLKMLHHAEAIK